MNIFSLMQMRTTLENSNYFKSCRGEKVVMNERAKQADAEAKIAAIREQLAALK